MRSPQLTPAKPTKRRLYWPWRDILDVLAFGAWSAMLFRYWFSGKILLLLHPNYTWLSHSAAFALVGLVALTLFKIFRQMAGPQSGQTKDMLGHVTLMPPNISSALLLGVAIFGLIYTPRAFASQTALQRGISETLSLTRSQPQRFVRAAAPEERTIIDWIRLVNVYPEPDAYAGEPVDVVGFVIHPENWPDEYVMVARFVITCCAADVYPVGLPIKLSAQERSDYPVDSWLRVTGEMTSETLDGRRQLAIAPTNIQQIAEPKNPYEY